MAKKSPKQSENAAARGATEAYASPFSTAFGGTAPSTELDAARQYASPFSTAFGGTAPTTELEAAREYASPFSTAFGGTAPTFAKDIPATSGADADAAAKAAAAKAAADKEAADRLSKMSDAYQRLYDEFNALGLGTLVSDAKDLLMKATSVAGIPDALRTTKAYTDRFSANDARIKAGLRALSPAEYLELEDSYQKVMRNYGLPATYYTPGLYGKQPGFEKLLAGDVSAVELEDRISTAQNRVLKANPEVTTALKQFYPDITNGDILAYTLDPSKGLEDIKRKVTAAEIGGAAIQSGLTTGMARAEELQRYGVDKAAAEKGYTAIGAGLQRGSELASIYGESPYTQATAEEEIFNVPGAAKAREKRQKITGLEKATFGGQSGLTAGALARDRAGGI
jgi:hypothetical protein